MIPVLVGMLLFASFHSLTAAGAIKRWSRWWLGERFYYGFYRAMYNIISIVTIAPILVYIAKNQGDVVIELGAGWRLPMLVIQVIGMIGFVLSLVQIDIWRFAGLRQMWAYFKGNPLPLPDEPLVEHGVYGLVRHPLYLFSLMLIWSGTSFTEGGLGFNIAVTLYLVIGSFFEEHKMAQSYGQRYRDYRERVPWLIPGVRLPLIDSVTG